MNNAPISKALWRVLAAAAVVAAVAAFFSNMDLAQWHQDTAGDVISATCLARFGADEHGVRLPLLNLEGFGDFKEPVFSYLLALVFIFFKPSVATARVVSLSLGVCGLAACVLFAGRLISRQAYRWSAAGFFCFGLLSLWLIGPQHFACAPALSTPIVALLLWTTKNILDNPASLPAGLAFGLAAMLAPYCGPAMKFAMAADCLLLAFFFFRLHGFAGLAFKRARGLYLGAAFVTLALAPFVADALTSRLGLFRPGQVIETDPWTILANWVGMFDPRLLFFRLPGSSSYATGYGGLLNVVFLPFVVLGAFSCLRQAFKGDWFPAFLLCFLLLALVPASLVRVEFMPSTPHRSLIAYPCFILMAFYGAEAATGFFRDRRTTLAFTLVACLWLLGGYEAFKTVRQFSRSLSVCTDFSKQVYLRDIPRAWDDQTPLAPCDTFTPATVYYRYYRLVEKGDLCYCNAPGQDGREKGK